MTKHTHQKRHTFLAAYCLRRDLARHIREATDLRRKAARTDHPFSRGCLLDASESMLFQADKLVVELRVATLGGFSIPSLGGAT